MSSANDLVLNLRSITAIGMEDINGDSATPRMLPGTITIVVDAFGPKVLQYIRNRTATVQSMGECVSKMALVAVSNITSGTTTSFVTTGLTADDHQGKLAYVLDDAGAAGAAPEGEVSIVAGNTATAVTLEPDYPFSAALAANDDIDLIANWQDKDAADGDEAVDVLGIVLANGGISSGNYGWVQREGFVVADFTTDAVTAGDPVVAAAAALDEFGSDGQELWCGVALDAIASDQVALAGPVNLKLFTSAGTGASP